jgi:TATA-binding protein-associated factor
MATDQILDLFNLSEGGDMPALDQEKAPGEENAVTETGEVREKGKKGYLDEIGELWDEGLYEEEFSLDGFLGKMKG